MTTHSRKILYHRKNILLTLVACSGGAYTISIIAWLAQESGVPMLIPPFGATCFLIFLLPESTFAHPRNIVGGHLLSTVIGLTCLTALGSHWWVSGLSVALAMLSMRLTKTMHPPAAGDPLFIIMQAQTTWSVALAPILLGSIILACSAYAYRNFVFQHLQRIQNVQPESRQKVNIAISAEIPRNTAI